ncbi:MAG: hypothetical protein AAGI46_11775, partial [Planctomycetota bacterium]
MILLFVVVLLSLLAVLGSAFLISSRLSADQVPPSERGSAETSDTTRTPPLSFDANLSKVETLIRGQLVLDLMARSGTRATPETDEVGTSLTLTSGRRDFADAQLLWRPTDSQQDAIFADDIFDPLASFAADNVNTPGRALSAGGVIDIPYLPVDAGGGTDPHLASHPHRDDRGNTDPTDDVVLWPWVSGPLVGLPGYSVDPVFVDPFGALLGGTLDVVQFDAVDSTNRRANLTPGLYRNGEGLDYSAPSPPRGQDTPNTEINFYNDRNRSFLALFYDGDDGGNALNGIENVPDGQQLVGDNSESFFAADADGDGVADSGLVPLLPGDDSDAFAAAIALPVGDPLRYQHDDGYWYFYAMRIVDNSALPHVDTAMSRLGDRLQTAAFDSDATFARMAAADVPNWGIYPGNVGLREAFPVTDPLTDSLPNGYDGDDEFNMLMTLRAGGLGTRNGANILEVDVETSPTQARTDLRYATIAEAYGIGLAQRLYVGAGQVESGNDTSPDGGAASFAGVASGQVAAQLAFNGGGWVVPQQQSDRNALESLMPATMLVSGGNFVPQVDYIWHDFPIGANIDINAPVPTAETGAARRSLWFDQFHGLDPDDTLYDYEQALVLNSTGGTIDDFPRSPRAGLTGAGGVSGAIRAHTVSGANGPGSNDRVPEGMPAYDPLTEAAYAPDYTVLSGSLDATFENVTSVAPVRASLNTDLFALLWRGFWNIMADDDTGIAVLATVSDAFADPLLDRVAAGATAVTTLDAEQTRRLRSAIAAVNAMDIRDVERIADRGDTDVTVATVPLDETNAAAAHVFGTEVQPFISEAVVAFVDDPANPGTALVDYLAVELVNPYPYEIDTTGWRLVAVDRTGATLAFHELAEFPAAIPAGDPAAGTFSFFVFADGTEPAALASPVGLVENLADITAAANAGVIRELMIMRPALSETNAAQAGIAVSLDTALADSASPAWQFMAPVDAADFGGITAAAGFVYHYNRLDPASTPRRWDFVYHGALAGGTAGTTIVERVDGTETTLGAISSDIAQVTAADLFPIPLGPALSGLGAREAANGTSFYPYGGFARDGDVLQLPYIGGYHVIDP